MVNIYIYIYIYINIFLYLYYKILLNINIICNIRCWFIYIYIYLYIIIIIEGVKEKNLVASLIFVDFSKAFDSIHRAKMAQILKSYGIQMKIINAMFYMGIPKIFRRKDIILTRNRVIRICIQNTPVPPIAGYF